MLTMTHKGLRPLMNLLQPDRFSTEVKEATGEMFKAEASRYQKSARFHVQQVVYSVYSPDVYRRTGELEESVVAEPEGADALRIMTKATSGTTPKTPNGYALYDNYAAFFIPTEGHPRGRGFIALLNAGKTGANAAKMIQGRCEDNKAGGGMRTITPKGIPMPRDFLSVWEQFFSNTVNHDYAQKVVERVLMKGASR